MINTFDKLEARMSVEADRYMGEPATLRLMAKAGANTRPAPDPSRTDFIATVIFKESTAIEGIKLEKVDINQHSIECSVDLRSLTARVVVGDRLHRPKTDVTYRVSNVFPDGEGRVVFELQVIAASPQTQ